MSGFREAPLCRQSRVDTPAESTLLQRFVIPEHRWESGLARGGEEIALRMPTRVY